MGGASQTTSFPSALKRETCPVGEKPLLGCGFEDSRTWIPRRQNRTARRLLHRLVVEH